MPAAETVAIETVEMHTGGEPVRIVTAGYPPVPGSTILDKRRYARDHLDHLRRMLIFEPRGHHDMYGVHAGRARSARGRPRGAVHAQRGLFDHVRPRDHRARPLCGRHWNRGARSGAWTVVNIQCPCGLVRAGSPSRKRRAGRYRCRVVRERAVLRLRARCRRRCAGRRPIALDIGYGGAFYALLPASAIGLDLDARLRDLVDARRPITRHVAATVPLEHPDDPDLAFLYGTILTDGGDGGGDGGPERRNICVFAEREVDRSPTGSGVSARMAIMAARGEVDDGETRAFSSVTGSVFTARLASRMKAGDIDAVSVEVSGRAHYTGESRFTLEPGDELGRGFLLR
jgi:proline racemase